MHFQTVIVNNHGYPRVKICRCYSQNTGFPRIKYGAGLVESGTKVKELLPNYTGDSLNNYNPKKAFWMISAVRSSLPVPWWMVRPV
jgi:hypothetical protein